MLHYILVLFAVLAVFGNPVLETLASFGPFMDYAVAFGIALLLKPWLGTHFE